MHTSVPGTGASGVGLRLRDPKISERSQLVRPFASMALNARMAQMRDAGRDPIVMNIGEPSQGAPAPVRHRAAEIMSDGTDLGYSEVQGILPLREAIAGHYRDWYGVDVDPNRIFVTAGSSVAFALTFLACFDAGDRVAMARPWYTAYEAVLRANGCEVVGLECGPESRFQPTVEMLAAAHDEAPLSGIMLASPGNPTGTMLDGEQLHEITEWARARGIRVISDEIYQGITYGPSRGETVIAHDPEAIVVNSFSKYWGMTGWRLGWVVVPESIVPTLIALGGNLQLCAPVNSQWAAVEGFTEESYAECDAAVAGFARARQMVLDALPSLGWKDVAPCDGAFYIWGRLDAEVLGPYSDAAHWCAALLDEAEVALSPGLDFDPYDGQMWVRMSLAVGPEKTREALDRIIRFTKKIND
ncbi:pyridoxal phosphate-dependent aminotransferase [Brevibacterium litoralis]|uniref:pyridoxal phosphate-dependent aminotransferase n=1 Tax=Brevibacterium litoralis TaxID=3138935 RepID=UPI0032F07B3F